MLLLNAEQYDYSYGLPGSRVGAGFTIRIHDPREHVVQMADSGVLVPVGQETNIALSREEVRNVNEAHVVVL